MHFDFSARSDANRTCRLPYFINKLSLLSSFFPHKSPSTKLFRCLQKHLPILCKKYVFSNNILTTLNDKRLYYW